MPAKPVSQKRNAKNESRPGLLREGIIITTLTIIGKATGFVREWMVAFFYGTSIIADALRIALDLSKNLQHILCGNQVETAFIPLLTRWRTRNANNSASILVRFLAWFFLLFSLITAVIVNLIAEKITQLQVVGYSVDDAAIVTTMIRWIAPSIPLFVACFFTGYMLASIHRFRLFSSLNLFINVTLIVFIALVGFGKLPEILLVIGYNLSALVLLSFLLWDIRDWDMKRVRITGQRILKILIPFLANFWPLLLLAIAVQSRVFIDKRIVSVLGVGSVAALWYARFIVETPAATAGLALMRILLPRFSEMVEKKKAEDISREFLVILEVSLWALLPIAVILALASKPIVLILFGYGAFDESAASVTALALVGASPVLWTKVVTPLINRVFNAQGRNRILLGIGVTGTALNIGLAYVLLPYLNVAGMGIAMAIAQMTVILFLIPKLPGNITFKAYRKIFLWWSIAAGLYILLSSIPQPAAPILAILWMVFITLISWLVISLVLPDGRVQLKRIVRTLKKNRSL